MTNALVSKLKEKEEKKAAELRKSCTQAKSNGLEL